MRENSILLQVNNVGYRVGTTKILNNISFDLRPGEFKLITGPSGCGKSTLLKIIASLQSPTSGKILFPGRTSPRSTRKTTASTSRIAPRRLRCLAIPSTII